MAVIDIIKKVYIHIPIKVINLLAPIYYVLPEDIRYGSTFRKQKKELEEVEFLSESEYKERIDEKFTELVKHCYTNVPYYRRLFDNNGLQIDMFNTVEDIKKIPFLTKDILREEMDQLIAEGVSKEDLLLITTSGTTGTPLGIYVDSDSTMKEWAYTMNLWKRIGCKPSSSRLILRGKHFREQIRKGKTWQYDALRRELSCDIHNMCEKNLEEYCKVIEKYKPEFIHGYPSAIYTLCMYIQDRGLNHQFKGVLAVSETLSLEKREFIEKTLNTRIFSFYGHSERLVIAGECESSQKYHVEPFYGIAEIIDENGEIIEDSSSGELVATGFCNKGMPLLRYKTGDLAKWSEERVCACNRHTKLIEEVLGRKKEILVNKYGKPLLLTSLHYEFFEQNVKQLKFVQEELGKVKFLIVIDENYSDKDGEFILKTLQEDTNKTIDFEIIVVEEISAKLSGKRELVMQMLDTKQWD